MDSFPTSFDRLPTSTASPDVIKEAALLINRVSSLKTANEALKKAILNPPKNANHIRFRLDRTYYLAGQGGYVIDLEVEIQPEDIEAFIQSRIANTYERLVALGVNISSL